MILVFVASPLFETRRRPRPRDLNEITTQIPLLRLPLPLSKCNRKESLDAHARTPFPNRRRSPRSHRYFGGRLHEQLQRIVSPSVSTRTVRRAQ
ncbi:hypothetical protein L596_001040 [Steinernema carpocapsae]|uniref:Uncharacterized protein n=1 Tax=Steinernema carpocapsae TaxID=34508 RepID=A0A4U8UKL7_STECR|nr:hypothetical protein L596_001040 [Steinernema carpocapsae]